MRHGQRCGAPAPQLIRVFDRLTAMAASTAHGMRSCHPSSVALPSVRRVSSQAYTMGSYTRVQSPIPLVPGPPSRQWLSRRSDVSAVPGSLVRLGVARPSHQSRGQGARHACVGGFSAAFLLPASTMSPLPSRIGAGLCPSVGASFFQSCRTTGCNGRAPRGRPRRYTEASQGRPRARAGDSPW